MARTSERTGRPRRRPTKAEARSPARLKLFRLVRRVVIALMMTFVALGIMGMFGSKTARVSATGGEYTLAVEYPRITRPGLPVRWVYTVRRAGGFDGDIHISTTFAYLNLFDLTNIQPDASSQTSTGEAILWSFDPPHGGVFSVEFDAAAEVGLHELPRATAAVVVDGRPVVTVTFRTVVVP